MNKVLWLNLVLVTFLAISCSKKISPVSSITTSRPALEVEEIDFEYLQGKARLILRDSKKEREVKANIRVRKDSVIWMTFSVIGLQGGKALINKDSITIVSNLDKEYYVFDYAELSSRYNFEINFNVIQSAMLGNLILPRSDEDEVVQETSFFIVNQTARSINIHNYVNSASMKIEKVEMKQDSSNNSLVMNYSNFQPLRHKLFPYNGTINLFYKTLSGVLNTTIIFEYNKAEVGDKELRFPFNIPRRYVRR